MDNSQQSAIEHNQVNSLGAAFDGSNHVTPAPASFHTSELPFPPPAYMESAPMNLVSHMQQYSGHSTFAPPTIYPPMQMPCTSSPSSGPTWPSPFFGAPISSPSLHQLGPFSPPQMMHSSPFLPPGLPPNNNIPVPNSMLPLPPPPGLHRSESASATPLPPPPQQQQQAQLPFFPAHQYPLPPRAPENPPQPAALSPPPVQAQIPSQSQPVPPAAMQSPLTPPAYYSQLQPPPAPATQPVKPCDVWHCFRPAFCQLAPCGCTLCREHLGSVIRGAQIVEQSNSTSVTSAGQDLKSPQTKTPATSTLSKQKIFTCASCRARSITAGPAAHKHFQQQQQHGPGGLTAAGTGETMGEFSIHYRQHEPVLALPPGTVFSDQPQNVSPDAPFRVSDQATSSDFSSSGLAYPSLTLDTRLDGNGATAATVQGGQINESPSSMGGHPGTEMAVESLHSASSQSLEPFFPLSGPAYDSPSMYPMILGPESHNDMLYPLSVYAPWTAPPMPAGPPLHSLPTLQPPMYPDKVSMQQSLGSFLDRRVDPARRSPRSRAFSAPFRSSSVSTGLPARPIPAKDSMMSLSKCATATKGELTMTRGLSMRRYPPAHRHRSIDLTRGLDSNSDAQAPLWPIVKIENVPFATTVADLERWLPADSLPKAEHVVHPIHLILHRVTGRTLPHCYVEMRSLQVANDVLNAMDRTQLGDRTVRVRWERRGELLRDLFSQEGYFSAPAASLAAAPLPPAPMYYQLPQTVITEKDLDLLLGYCRTLAFMIADCLPLSQESTEHSRERPPERAFLNLASIIAKFPWHEPELCSPAATEIMADAVHAATTLAARKSAAQPQIYRRVWLKLKAVSLDCPGFSDEQKRLIGGIEPSNVAVQSSPSQQLPESTQDDGAQSSQSAVPASDAEHGSHVDERNKTPSWGDWQQDDDPQRTSPRPSERRSAAPELKLFKHGQRGQSGGAGATVSLEQHSTGMIVLPHTPPSTPPPGSTDRFGSQKDSGGGDEKTASIVNAKQSDVKPARRVIPGLP